MLEVTEAVGIKYLVLTHRCFYKPNFSIDNEVGPKTALFRHKTAGTKSNCG